MTSTGSKTPPNQYRLDLVSLECVRRQDTVGRDEPKLLVNGSTVYGPGNIGKGESVDLRPRSALFTSVAHIDLMEVDSGADDDLGTVTATASQAGKGELRGEYSRPNADYEITYKVARV